MKDGMDLKFSASLQNQTEVEYLVSCRSVLSESALIFSMTVSERGCNLANNTRAKTLYAELSSAMPRQFSQSILSPFLCRGIMATSNHSAVNVSSFHICNTIFCSVSSCSFFLRRCK